MQTSNLFLYKCDVSFRPIHPTYFQLLEEMDYYYVADSNAMRRLIIYLFSKTNGSLVKNAVKSS